MFSNRSNLDIARKRFSREVVAAAKHRGLFVERLSREETVGRLKHTFF